MPKKAVGDEYFVSETGNWNVASGFVEEKVMKPFIKVDIYEEMALYGYESILEELSNFEHIPKDYIKVVGLKRLIRELIRLCKNTKFAMKTSGTESKLQEIEDRLYNIEEILPLTFEVSVNQIHRTSSVSINDNFSKVLEEVLKLKSDINIPLNKNHLIFTDKQEFDPVAFKNRIKQRMINKG